MYHFTKKSSGFTLLEVMVSLFIFSVVLGVIFLSFNTNFKIMNSSANMKNDVDDVDHCAYYIKKEIERSSRVIIEQPNWTHFNQSMGFVLVKNIDNEKNYVYFTKENDKIIRFAFTDFLSFDELKEHGPNGRIYRNKLKDNAEDFSFSHDDNYIYLEENGKKFVVYIGDKEKWNENREPTSQFTHSTWYSCWWLSLCFCWFK